MERARQHAVKMRRDAERDAALAQRRLQAESSKTLQARHQAESAHKKRKTAEGHHAILRGKIEETTVTIAELQGEMETQRTRMAILEAQATVRERVIENARDAMVKAVARAAEANSKLQQTRATLTSM